MVVAAKTIVNNGNIQANGGRGGRGADAILVYGIRADGGGGGGGGGGGVIVLIYDQISGTGTKTVAGGAGGAGGSGAGNGSGGYPGSPGGDGLVIEIKNA